MIGKMGHSGVHSSGKVVAIFIYWDNDVIRWFNCLRVRWYKSMRYAYVMIKYLKKYKIKVRIYCIVMSLYCVYVPYLYAQYMLCAYICA